MATQQTFSWASAADVFPGVAQAYISADLQSSMNRAQDKIRAANNKRAAAQNSLAATVRSINNRRIMAAAGKEYNAQATNRQRMAESFTRGNLEETLRSAETAGAIASRNAASGVAGASLNAVAYASQLSVARAQVAREDQQGQMTYDQGLQLAGIIPTANASLERGMLNANQDYTTSGSSSTPIFSSLLQGLLNKKDSVQTLLGSIGTSDSKAQTYAVGEYGSGMATTDLPAFTSTPVVQYQSIRTQ